MLCSEQPQHLLAHTEWQSVLPEVSMYLICVQSLNNLFYVWD